MILVIILGGIAFLGELLSALSRVLYPLPGWLGMVNDQQIHHGKPPVKFSMTPRGIRVSKRVAHR